ALGHNLMAALNELVGGRGQQRDTIFLVFDFPGNADDHGGRSNPVRRSGPFRREFAEQVFALLEQAAEAGVARTDSESRAKRLAGLVHFAQVQLAKSHALPGAEMAGAERHHALAIGDGPLVAAGLPIKTRAPVP